MDKKKKKTSYLEAFGIFLHPNLSIHLIISIIINFILGITIVGVFHALNYPLLTYLIVGFILYIIIFSLVELAVTIFVVRHLLKPFIKSRGLLLILTYALIFYLTTLVVTDVSFNSNVILKVLVFTVVFLIFKTILIIIYQRYLVKKKEN